jgi:acyl-CoA reductase-like NAD-dependent aldehyde dehydrogenase
MIDAHECVASFLSRPEQKMLIDGEWAASRSGKTQDAVNPSDGTSLGRIASGDAADIDAAVSAARKAFPSWSSKAPGFREEILRRFAKAIMDHAEELARLESLENGKPYTHTFPIDAPVCGRNMMHASGLPSRILGETIPVSIPGMFVYARREPLGVIGIITPWNYPLIHFSQKVGPAIAAGNCVVLKPASLASLAIVRLGELALEAGMPDGVLNVVTGSGSSAGSALASHPGVNKVQFTGSTAVGKSIIKSAAENVKRVTLELGSKAPDIVFADADLEKAAEGAFLAAFANSGQSCVAGSRLYVEESIFDDFVARIVDRARRTRVGHAMEAGTELGPIVDRHQFEAVMGYVAQGKKEGRTLCGGEALLPPAVPAGGFYIAPTVFAGIDDDSILTRDEIFGPVLCVYPFKGEEEVVARANATRYGLAAGLWTADIARATRVSAALEAGVVWINTYDKFSANVPFGGFKESGYGRDNGTASVEAVTEMKSVWINTNR